ncbi:MAG: hypothetical protein ACK4N5_18815 [Myxococcales bacterium]
MLKKFAMGLMVVASAIVLNGCGASCEDACSNTATVCKKDLFQDDQAAADAFKTACITECNAAVADESKRKCTNGQEILDCNAAAATCAAVTECGKKCIPK